MQTWSADELATFLAFTAQDRELALYHVAAATGMRRGQLLGLRWRSRWGSAVGATAVHATRKIPRFRSAEELQEHPHNRPRRGDSGPSTRTARAPTVRAPRLGQGLPSRPGPGSSAGPVDHLRTQTFIGRRFGRRIRDLARLPAIGLHGLRHTLATLLLEEGVVVKTVSERLRHNSVQTTLELYGHVTPKMRGNAATRFGSLLSSARVAPADAMIAEN